MDKISVDGAIFISAFSLCATTPSCAVEVQRGHSERFAIVKPVDPADPAVADVVADWKERLGAVGVHIILMKEEEAKREWNLRRELLLVNERAIFRAFSVPRTIKATALRAAGWLNPRQLMARLCRPGRCSKSAAFRGTPVVLPTWSRRQPLPSRPGEFHPESLTDPDVILSHHPARATKRRLPPSVDYRAPPVAGDPIQRW